MPAQTTIKIRRGTAAQWTSANSVLSAGEMGFETDTRKLKVGDGTTAWSSLSYTIDGLAADITAASLGALTSETTTTLAINANILTYTDETGADTDIDLSLYLDDTNLARITSGVYDRFTGLATFTRDDNTTFTVDFSELFSDSFNLNVAADDSTLRTINAGETISVLGAGTVTTTSDDEGAITITGSSSFDLTGNVTGNVTGDISGNVTGDLQGSVFADDSTLIVDAVNGIVTANVTGDITGDVTGNLTGNVTGDVTGNLTGNVTGDITGNITGNITGDLTGSVLASDSTVLVDGTSGTLQLYTLSQEGATDGQALLWNDSNSRWQPGTPDVYLVDGGRSDSIYTNGDLVLDAGDST